MPFTLCLNTSTISGQKLSLIREIEIAARAGYQAIEPWVRELDEYVRTGGTLKDIRKRASDEGLAIANLIGFAEWIVEEPDRRTRGLEEARRNFAQAADLGCPFVAAPPFGCHDRPGPSLDVIAERYATLLEIGRSFGVTPLLEFWGFSKTLSTLAEASYVAMQTGDPTAKLLVDPYHLYRGGSNPQSISLLHGTSIGVVHMNDFPAIDRLKITDGDRVYPGDGVASLDQWVKTLKEIGYDGVLSLELFSPALWAQDAYHVAETGIGKLRSLI